MDRRRIVLLAISKNKKEIEGIRVRAKFSGFTDTSIKENKKNEL